ncbi:hypothetical protein PR001_g33847, partial [Phytophthora rubi]
MVSSSNIFALCIATVALSSGVRAEQAVAQTLGHIHGLHGLHGLGVGVGGLGVYGPGVYGPGLYGPGVYGGAYGPGVYGPGVYGPGVGVGAAPAVAYNSAPAPAVQNSYPSTNGGATASASATA